MAASKAKKPKAKKPNIKPATQTAIDKLNRITAKAAKKPAAQRYAGMTIKPLFKPEEVGARENTWTYFMIMAALKSATTDAAQKKVDDSKEFAGKRVDIGWLCAKGYITVQS